MSVRAGVALLALAALAAAGCGRKEEPKADAATGQAQALERAKSGAFGTQVKALEAAKALQADVDRKSQEALEKSEQGGK